MKIILFILFFYFYISNEKIIPPEGSLFFKKDMLKIQNLVMVNRKLYLFLDENNKKKFEEKLLEHKNTFYTGIGGLKTGIYFDTWSNKEQIQERTILIEKLHPKNEKETSSMTPIYVIYSDTNKIKNFETEYIIEKRNTIIFSTMWKNIFRIIYAVNAAFFSLIEFNEFSEDPLFLEYDNNVLFKQNMERMTNPDSFFLSKKVVNLFGSYKMFLSSKENIIYKNVFLGVPADSLFLEIENVKTEEYSKIPYEKRKKTLKKIKKHVFKKLKISNPKNENVFIVLIIERKIRKIINNDEIIMQINSFKSKLEEKAKKKFVIKKIDFEDISLEEQIRLVSECDLLIALHGAALTHLIFMKKNSSILEIFPYCFRKTIYENMAQHTNVNYFYWQNKHLENTFDLKGKKITFGECKVDWSSQESRDTFRNQNTYVEPKEIKAVLDEILISKEKLKENPSKAEIFYYSKYLFFFVIIFLI